MPAFAEVRDALSVAALLICGAAYVYGYLFRPRAFRPLHVWSLCFTGLALMQLVIFMHAEHPSRVNVDYAMAFLVLAALGQAAVAVRSRKRRTERGARATDRAGASRPAR